MFLYNIVAQKYLLANPSGCALSNTMLGKKFHKSRKKKEYSFSLKNRITKVYANPDLAIP